MTTRNFPEAGSTFTPQLSKLEAKSIDFASRFGGKLTDFIELLGITEVTAVQEGFQVTIHGSMEVDLQDGNVDEGELIPLSQVTPKDSRTEVITLNKHRKNTSIEAIQKYGYDQAVQRTDNAFLDEIQTNVRNGLFNALKNEEGSIQTNLNKNNGLQGALASAWGGLQVVFENDAVQTIAFANPMDVAQANADKQVTIETAFGLNYYTTLTGTKVIMSTQIPIGAIYATAPQNLNMFYIPTSAASFRAFELKADSTGFIGVTHDKHKQTLTTDTIAVYGIGLFPERLDGIVRVGITEDVTAVPAG